MPEMNKILLSIAGGATSKRSDNSLYAASGVRFLRILNVEDGEILDRNLKYITEKVHQNKLARSQLDVGDVLMTITGRVGSAAVVHKEHLPANINQHIARLRVDTTRYRLEFLSEWLNCPIGQNLSNRFVSGGTRAALNYGAIRSIRIPLPDLLEQDRLLNVMNAARADCKAKVAEADSLMSDVNDFVLDTLGLTLPKSDLRRAYAVMPTQIRGQFRIDSDYYHPERTMVLRSLDIPPDGLGIVSLSDIVCFERKKLKAPTEPYLGMSHIQSHTGELTNATDTASGSCFAYQPHDILFAGMAPYLNKVYRAETDGTCSTEFYVLRIKDTETLLPDYLAAILRSNVVLAQTVHMMTGSTRPRLTNYDVANLKVPIPALSVQQTIAAEVGRRRQKARYLRAEAEMRNEAAKHWFERELLGTHPRM